MDVMDLQGPSDDDVPPEERGDVDSHEVSADLLELYEVLEWDEATR